MEGHVVFRGVSFGYDKSKPVLHDIEQQQLVPESYPFGSHGPPSARLGRIGGVERARQPMTHDP